MTLNELEWLFYVKFSLRYYEQRFQKLFFLHIYRSSLFISRDQRICAEADRVPQNIWDPQKNRRSFIDATLHRRNLNNKVNISI